MNYFPFILIYSKHLRINTNIISSEMMMKDPPIPTPRGEQHVEKCRGRDLDPRSLSDPGAMLVYSGSNRLPSEETIDDQHSDEDTQSNQW